MDLQIEPLMEHAQDIAGSAIDAAKAVAERIADATDVLVSDSKKSSKGTSWLVWLVLAVVAFLAVGGVLFKRKRSNDVAMQEVVEDAATGADVPRPAMAS
jgi:LPXTG-motif cell wall-anchored protein